MASGHPQEGLECSGAPSVARPTGALQGSSAVRIVSTVSRAQYASTVRILYFALTLLTGAPFAASQEQKEAPMYPHPYSFRPGSGALVQQPSSQARATALTPLLSLQSASFVASATLALISLAALFCMAYRHNHNHHQQHHQSGGHRPLGSAHIPPHHLGKIPLSMTRASSTSTASDST